MKDALITIGESIHASIPKTAEMMKRLSKLGPNAYSSPSEPLDYIKTLIQSQVADPDGVGPDPVQPSGLADYIAVNLDAFGEDDPQVCIDMMVHYVELVRKFSCGVPICIDSSNDDVLKEGLEKWYDINEKVKPPLINSVKVYTMENIFPLKRNFDFSFVGMLVGEDLPAGLGSSNSVEQMYSLAKQIFETAVGQYGFKPEQIYFDSTVFPLAIDMPMEPNVPGYTYRTFETIKKIKTDPEMKGVHCVLGITNCARDLPGRKVGICRAYVAKAMEYGLDSAIVNVAHHYGSVEPDAELLQLVGAYAKMDGSSEKMNKAIELMGRFCQQSRKPAK